MEQFQFLLSISNQLEGIADIPQEFTDTFNQVLEISQYDSTIDPDDLPGIRFSYVLVFPEIFYPKNAAAFFWSKVTTMMQKGIMFDIKTSDVIAWGWVPNQGSLGKVGLNWRGIERSNPDGTTNITEKKGAYGGSIAALNQIKF